MRQTGIDGLRAPALVVDLDLVTEPSSDAPVLDTSRHRMLWCLARSAGLPLGVTFWDVAEEAQVNVGELRDRLRRQCPTAAAQPPTPQATSRSNLTVAMCTRERPDSLRRALASLVRQSDTAFSVVIVDNAPVTTATREVVEEFGQAEWRYLLAPEPGLSRARNTALDAVSSDLIAWMDDDEIADVDWVRRLKQGFEHDSDPSAVSGLMLPAELETEAQVRFEQYGGFNKGRGFTTEVLAVAAGTVKSPMYPLPNFGAGGNMAFRVDALRAAGGFDPHLGAGTTTHGGEETRALALVLRAGGTVLHWPSAITWHYHRREMTELRDQFRGYSAGLSAFFASMLLSDTVTSTREVVRVLPTAVRHVRPGQANRRTGHLPADFPRDLIRAGRVGFVEGGVAYLRERRRTNPRATTRHEAR